MLDNIMDYLHFKVKYIKRTIHQRPKVHCKRMKPELHIPNGFLQNLYLEFPRDLFIELQLIHFCSLLNLRML